MPRNCDIGVLKLIKCDPKSVLLYRTLLDARRLMLKSEIRRKTFITHLREMVARGQGDNDIVIGPAKGVLEVTSEWFVETPVKGNDMMLRPRHGPPCSLFETCDRVFKSFLEQVARQEIWSRLASQMKSPNPRRKDMTEMHSLINVQATMAPANLAKKMDAKIPQKLETTASNGGHWFGGCW